jgi:YVTN family beta-propeller protein
MNTKTNCTSLVSTLRGWKVYLAILLTAIAAGCGGGGDESANAETVPPDLRGVWAGTWTGNSAAHGLVTGTWEADITRQEHATGASRIWSDGENLYGFILEGGVPRNTYVSNTRIEGNGSLRGDVDCMDGDIEGLVEAKSLATFVLRQIIGDLLRPGCNRNYWQLTSIDISGRTASGLWSQSGSGDQGTFTGRRIADLGGVRIRYFNPPSGAENALVTIAGENFSTSLADNHITFGTDAATVTEGSANTLTMRVPSGTSDEQLELNTPDGNALSPVAFLRDVTFPPLLTASTIATSTGPHDVAISPDGRKVFVTHPATSRVHLIDVANDVVLRNVSLSGAKNVVATPDGHWVYVTTGSSRIAALDAARLIAIPARDITVTSGGSAIALGAGPDQTPQGLALSPDGRTLYGTQNVDGGAAVVIDIASKSTLLAASKGAGTMPVGVAPHPDGKTVYLAFSGYGIVALDTATLSLSDVTGPHTNPSGLVVTPDGAKLYVADRLANVVNVFDAITNTWLKSVVVGIAPMGMAVSPDGARIYVSESGGNTVSVIRVVDDVVTDGPLLVGTSPSDIVITPDGKSAYVANRGSSNVSSLGGSLSLTIGKAGTGSGTVTSDPVGIVCGLVCRAKFSSLTVVKLQAAPNSNSTFTGWSGDADCVDGEVTLDSSKTCAANFQAIAGSGSVGSSDCFIATAAYGSSMALDVMLLRQFRDEHLLTNRLGTAFVEFYYKHSPPIADYLKEHENMRTAVRWGLQPIVLAIKYPGAFSGCLVILAFAGLSAICIRSRRKSQISVKQDFSKKSTR